MVHREKPEVRTLTHGVTRRPTGLGFAETVGMAGAAPYLEAAAAGIIVDRGLRAPGDMCVRCGETFLLDSPVRRSFDGFYVHDTCPR